MDEYGMVYVENQLDPYGDPAGCDNNQSGGHMTLEEYFRRGAPASFYKKLKRIAIANYVVAAVNAVTLIGMPFNILVWLDVLLAFSMGYSLTTHRRESTARAMLIYGVINFVGGFFLPLNGFGDLILLITGIMANSAFKKAKADYSATPKSVVDEAADPYNCYG